VYLSTRGIDYEYRYSTRTRIHICKAAINGRKVAVRSTANTRYIAMNKAI